MLVEVAVSRELQLLVLEGGRKNKFDGSLMIKVSFYSLNSDKKQIPVPPDRCPLRKKINQTVDLHLLLTCPGIERSCNAS